MTRRAAAPMRRRLCQVKEHQMEFDKRQWKECCRACLEGVKGVPASVQEVVRLARRAAHWEDQRLVADEVHV